jgi:hypothetical protein
MKTLFITALCLAVLLSEASAQIALQPKWPASSDPGYTRATAEIAADHAWKQACARPQTEACRKAIELSKEK